jgi:hypothetical protein
MEHRASFPFFSIPNFEVKAYGTRKDAKFETVAFAPIVQLHQLDQYLTFANASRNWLEESKLIYDKLEPGKDRSKEHPTPLFPDSLMCVDHREYEKDKSKVLLSPCSVQADEYLPLLHISPPPLMNETFNNIDFYTDPTYKTLTTAAKLVSDVVFSPIDLDPKIFDFVFGSEVHRSTTRTHPHTLAAAPVWSGLSGGQVIGYVFGVMDWANYMTGKVSTVFSFQLNDDNI